jgi:hypothetical protein
MTTKRSDYFRYSELVLRGWTSKRVKKDLGEPDCRQFNPEDLESIEETVLAHTRLVVDALGYEEMQSEGALLSHIANARVETNRLIRDRRPPSKQ